MAEDIAESIAEGVAAEGVVEGMAAEGVARGCTAAGTSEEEDRTSAEDVEDVALRVGLENQIWNLMWCT